jgi:hypothetical protein
MDKGRRLMAASALAVKEQQYPPRSLHPLPGPARLLIVGRVATATFWDMLADFVGLG